MWDIDIDVESGRDDPLWFPATSTDLTLINGAGRILGWSIRDAANDVAGSAQGSVVSPGAGVLIAGTGVLAKGTYLINWTVELIGAAAAADANNFEVVDSSGVLIKSINLGAQGDYLQIQIEGNSVGAGGIGVYSVAAGTVGVTYAAQIAAIPTGVPQAVVELQDGPSILGEASMESEKVHNVNFGKLGMPFFHGVKLHVIQGIVTGAVFARYGSP